MTYKFLIYISYPYSVPIGLPLQKEIENRGYEVFWFADVSETINRMDKSSKIFTQISDVVTYDADIILCATDTIPDFLKGLKVQIFHGFSANKRSFKKDHFRIRGLFDLYTTHGPSTTTIFKDLAKQYKTFDVIETGWSKVDPLFKIKQSTQKHKNILPTILISSTFTKRHSLANNQDVYREIERMAQTGNYYFHCVLHPKINKDIKEQFIALNGSHFQYHETTDFTQLFTLCDAMLSDTTSVISEFALMEKPIVTFRNNKPQNYFLNVTEISDIEPTLKLALKYPEELMLAIQEYIKDSHPYQDGNSSKRIIDATIKFLHQDKSYLKRKPCNLIRKYKIRKKLNYFPWVSFNKPKTI